MASSNRGLPGVKRKADHEYSQRMKTQYERERVQKKARTMTPSQLEEKRIKEADRQSALYHVKKLRETWEYKRATHRARKEMEMRKKDEVLENRRQERLSEMENLSSSVALESGNEYESGSDSEDEIGLILEDNDSSNGGNGIESSESENDAGDQEFEGNNSVLNDGDENQSSGDEDEETIHSDDIEVTEENEEVLRKMEQSEEPTTRWKELRNTRNGLDIQGTTDHLIRQYWVQEWAIARDNLIMTLDQLSKHPDDPNCRIEWVMQEQNGERIYLYPKCLPHELFGRKERSVWRNLAAWCPKLLNYYAAQEDDTTLTLPGPNIWWTHLWTLQRYNPKRHGFWKPRNPNRFRDAWDLLHSTDFFSAEDNRLMKKFLQSEEIGSTDDIFFF